MKKRAASTRGQNKSVDTASRNTSISPAYWDLMWRITEPIYCNYKNAKKTIYQWFYASLLYKPGVSAARAQQNLAVHRIESPHYTVSGTSTKA